AVDAVEGEAALEEVAEVQGQAPRQLRDAEQAEHAARAGLDLGELAVARVELERAVQREQREAGRAARPCGVEGGGPTAAVELAAVAQAAEQGTEILGLHGHADAGAGARAAAEPVALHVDALAWCGGLQLHDAQP